MYPNSIYLSLKVVSILVLWGQSIYYLGTWILWALRQAYMNDKGDLSFSDALLHGFSITKKNSKPRIPESSRPPQPVNLTV